jgi:16S rRNA (guanine527-N7)-methyltransferase
MLLKWGRRMNLVHCANPEEIYTRHILDCAQIAELLHKDDLIIDVGTGAGLPGIILSILGFNNVLLCEKNLKKCIFLTEVRSIIGLSFEICNGDVWQQNVSRETFCVTLVSRAFDKMEKLLALMVKIGATTGVFHKGISYQRELEAAKEQFLFDCEIKNSTTRDGCVIIKVMNVKSLR